MSVFVRLAACVAALTALAANLPVLAEPPLPASPIRLGDMFPRVPASDDSPIVVGLPDGRAVLLKVESSVVYASRSTDGGATFGEEVAITATAGMPPVRRVQGAMAPDGTVHVVATTSVGVSSGLWYVHGTDGGAAWTQPVQLLAESWLPGCWTTGSSTPRLAPGPGGRVAVVFISAYPVHVYTIGSTNGGVTWSGPVRADSSDQRIYAHDGVDGVFGLDGTLHLAWSTGSRVYCTRSTDGGVTFEPERDLNALVTPALTSPASYYPSLGIAHDGGVLVAFWDDDSRTRDRLYVARSTDAGATFGLALAEDLPNTNYARYEVQLWSSTASPSVLVSMIGSGGVLTVRSSQDHGATFHASQTLATGLPNFAPNWISGGYVPGAATWVLAWNDKNDDAYSQSLYSVYASSSLDGGVTWSTRQRASADAAGAATSTVTGVVGFDSGKVLVAMRDGHDDRDRSYRAYANIGTASPLALGTARRIGGWHSLTSPPLPSSYEISTASDSAGNVYVAAVAQSVGPFADVYVWASHDGARTFAPPVRVSAGPAGTQSTRKPWIAATSDGDVYVAYELSRADLTGNEVRLARSHDFGNTWDDAYLALFSTSAPQGVVAVMIGPGPRVAALPGGLVYVLFDAEANTPAPGLTLARSFDHGATFSDSVLYPDTAGASLGCLCAQHDQVVVAYDSDWGDDLWALVSQDRGATWSAPAMLTPAYMYAYPDRITLACDGGSKATVLWARDSAWAAHFDGNAWWPATELTSVSGWSASDAEGAFTSSGEFVAAWLDRYPTTARSSDGGKTFSTAVPLASAQPYAVRVASDGAGRIWATWSGYDVLSTLSTDAGRTFSPPRQVNTASITRFGSKKMPWCRPVTAWPGAALIAYLEARTVSSIPNLVVNVWDTADFDRDGHAPATDCNDEDAGTWAAPAEVAALQVTQVASTHVAWQDQAALAGTSTRYDVVSGDVASLANGTTGATCLAPRVAEASCTDEHGGPAAGTAIYYLARAVNACGTGTYGNAALDAASPCP